MKPHWQDAPTWAQWLAQDEDGEWNWFSEKPRANTLAEPGYWLGGNWMWAGPSPVSEDWNRTLEERS